MTILKCFLYYFLGQVSEDNQQFLGTIYLKQNKKSGSPVRNCQTYVVTYTVEHVIQINFCTRYRV